MWSGKLFRRVKEWLEAVELFYSARVCFYPVLYVHLTASELHSSVMAAKISLWGGGGSGVLLKRQEGFDQVSSKGIYSLLEAIFLFLC